jgi:hypothetical protein
VAGDTHLPGWPVLPNGGGCGRRNASAVLTAANSAQSHGLVEMPADLQLAIIGLVAKMALNVNSLAQLTHIGCGCNLDIWISAERMRSPRRRIRQAGGTQGNTRGRRRPRAARRDDRCTPARRSSFVSADCQNQLVACSKIRREILDDG